MTPDPDDIDLDAVDALREKWGIDQSLIYEKNRLGKAAETEERPLPKRIEVERVLHGFPTYPVWFIYGYDEAGDRSHLLDTSHAGLAQAEVRKYQALGIPVEVHKPWR